MEFLSPTTQITCGAIVLFTIAFLMYQPTGLVKWLQKKNYQYEVTSSLYMLTPTEKFVFNSVLFLTFSMFTIAVTLYLPDHLMMMLRRGYYYFAGEAAISDIPSQAAGKATEGVSSLVETVYKAATNTGASTQVAVSRVAGTVG